MQKYLLLLILFSGSTVANPNFYMSANALSNEGSYSVQYGFSYSAGPGIDIGYDVDYTQWNKDIHSFGMNVKPVFRMQPFYVAPVIGINYFNDDIDWGYSVGAELGYETEQATFKVGYKESSEDFANNDAFYFGVAVHFATAMGFN
ncbi:hypothetical protein ACU5DF_04440 [Aliivibrio wodanis]|uniref:Outer membrane protein beta-barrel domain-containing protein n=1 Tax=Aliivibrio wodanis TaxID=80852 RepID=A0A5Q4ZVX2_9GAMM|nr:hypothetical protein AW0309160_04092 [Aliivibrio wodanis]